jgi:hypothetical protein
VLKPAFVVALPTVLVVVAVEGVVEVGAEVAVVAIALSTAVVVAVVVVVQAVVPNGLKTVHALAQRAGLARSRTDPLSGVGGASFSSASSFFSFSFRLALPSSAATPCSRSFCNFAGKQVHLSLEQAECFLFLPSPPS